MTIMGDLYLAWNKIEELEKQVKDLEHSIRFSMRHGGHTAIPPHIRLCPECGGRLFVRSHEWDSETGKANKVGLEFECFDEHLNFTHEFKQSDWQPVINEVAEWLDCF